jgi:hypothetical protein
MGSTSATITLFSALTPNRENITMGHIMTSIANVLETSEFAHREADAYDLVRKYRRMSYVREAHHVHLVAQALAEKKLMPVNEVDYSRSYYKDQPGEGRTTRPRADVWCSESLLTPERETYVEVKLAGLWGDNRKRIGTKPAAVVLSWWADDIYRLMVGPDTAHCAFVLCIQGTATTTTFSPSLKKPLQCKANDADDLHIKLCTEPAQQTDATAAVERFLEMCRDELGALVTTLTPAPSQERHGVWFRPVVVEWLQDSPPKSEWMVEQEG